MQHYLLPLDECQYTCVYFTITTNTSQPVEFFHSLIFHLFWLCGDFSKIFWGKNQDSMIIRCWFVYQWRHFTTSLFSGQHVRQRHDVIFVFYFSPVSGRSVILMRHFDLWVREISVFLQSDCLFLQLLPSVCPEKSRKIYHVLSVDQKLTVIKEFIHP